MLLFPRGDGDASPPGRDGDPDESPPVEDRDGGDLDSGDLFVALRHPRRRYLLRALVDGDETTLAELATRVAASESGDPSSAVPEEKRRSVHVTLHHVHVPKLADLGLVDAEDRGEDTLVRATDSEQVRAIRDAIDDLDDTR